MHDYASLLRDLIPVIHRAGQRIMEIYRSNYTISYKTDATPVTHADIASQDIILEGMRDIAPDIPIISEEMQDPTSLASRPTGPFFLVDPLDGTAEFIDRNDQFTVNIALIVETRPIFGIVSAPSTGTIFIGSQELGALTLSPDHWNGKSCQLLHCAQPMIHSQRPCPPFSALLSRAHPSEKDLSFLRDNDITEVRTMGSSLKFCSLAAREADVCPRFGTTKEWDTAAGQALLQAAGGAVITQSRIPLWYGKSNLDYTNPPFIALSDRKMTERINIKI